MNQEQLKTLTSAVLARMDEDAFEDTVLHYAMQEYVGICASEAIELEYGEDYEHRDELMDHIEQLLVAYISRGINDMFKAYKE